MVFLFSREAGGEGGNPAFPERISVFVDVDQYNFPPEKILKMVKYSLK